MSIAEQAAQLRSIQLPFGAIKQAQAELDAAREMASQVLGTGGTGFQAVNGAIEQAKNELDGVYSMVQEVEAQLEQAATHHSAG